MSVFILTCTQKAKSYIPYLHIWIQRVLFRYLYFSWATIARTTKQTFHYSKEVMNGIS